MGEGNNLGNGSASRLRRPQQTISGENGRSPGRCPVLATGLFSPLLGLLPSVLGGPRADNGWASRDRCGSMRWQSFECEDSIESGFNLQIEARNRPFKPAPSPTPSLWWRPICAMGIIREVPPSASRGGGDLKAKGPGWWRPRMLTLSLWTLMKQFFIQAGFWTARPTTPLSVLGCRSARL